MLTNKIVILFWGVKLNSFKQNYGYATVNLLTAINNSILDTTFPVIYFLFKHTVF